MSLRTIEQWIPGHTVCLLAMFTFFQNVTESIAIRWLWSIIGTAVSLRSDR